MLPKQIILTGWDANKRNEDILKYVQKYLMLALPQVNVMNVNEFLTSYTDVSILLLDDLSEKNFEHHVKMIKELGIKLIIIYHYAQPSQFTKYLLSHAVVVYRSVSVVNIHQAVVMQEVLIAVKAALYDCLIENK